MRALRALQLAAGSEKPSGGKTEGASVVEPDARDVRLILGCIERGDASCASVRKGVDCVSARDERSG